MELELSFPDIEGFESEPLDAEISFSDDIGLPSSREVEGPSGDGIEGRSSDDAETQSSKSFEPPISGNVEGMPPNGAGTSPTVDFGAPFPDENSISYANGLDETIVRDPIEISPIEISPIEISPTEISPTGNTSRYGRARKQKTVTDFYPTDLLVFNGRTSYGISPSKSQKKSPSKTPKKSPSERLAKSPKKKSAKKTPAKRSSPKSAKRSSSKSAKGSSKKVPKIKNFDGESKPSPKVVPEGESFLENDFVESAKEIPPIDETPVKVYVGKDLTRTDDDDADDFVLIKREPLSPERELSVNFVRNVYTPKRPKLNLQATLDSLFGGNREGILPASEIKKEIVDDSAVPPSNGEISEREMNCRFKLGDLIWARVGTYPFWPGLVTRDPYTLAYVKDKVYGRSEPTDSIHLTFFADSGRRSWLSVNSLMMFTGLDDFNQIRAELSSEVKKRDPRYFKAFFVPSNQKSRWLSAVSEAEMLLRRPIEVREEFFRTMFLTSPTIYKASRKIKKEKIEVAASPNASLSESLFDSLIDNLKIEKEDSEEIVTPNKKQTHMDRWLVKAKMRSDLEKTDDMKEFKQIEKKKSPIKKSKKRKIDQNTSSDVDLSSKKIKQECIDSTKDDSLNTTMNDSQDNLDSNENLDDSCKRVLRSRGSEISGKTSECIEFKSSGDVDKTETKTPVKAPKNNSKYNDPDFQDFVELQKDYVEDQYPDLSENEIMDFLFKTWQYEQTLKANEVNEMDDFCTVKGMNDCENPDSEDDFKVKKPRQSKSTTKIEIDSPLNKDLRKKTIKSYFSRDSSSEDEAFECKSEVKSEKDEKSNKSPESVNVKSEPVETQEITSQAKPVDYYMLALSHPKPNIFKGLSKSKLCDICGSQFNLMKCKGPCGGTYHADCIEKQLQTPDEETPRKGKKKKGKKSLDKPDDENSDIDVSTHIVIDEDEFENMVSAKMQEMLENDNHEYDNMSVSSLDGIKKGDDFMCHNCRIYETPLCFVCNSVTSPKSKVEERQRCSATHCCKYYHLDCLKAWPQTKFNATASITKRNIKKVGSSMETLFCPRHVCHTCVCDDPKGSKSRIASERLARCIRCPATYHSFTHCVPAGSQLLSSSRIICPRHITYKMGKIPYHVNTAWCFICAKGGTLVCCETCPTSFHAECLRIELPEGGYICEDCETGRLPLYGEVMWVKFSHYRWWPAYVLYPSEVPTKIAARPHSNGQFVVRFFGGYDHYWVSGGRCFPYQEGDTGHASSKNSALDQTFVLAVKQAEEAYKIIKGLKMKKVQEQQNRSILPPQYIKLKVNRAVGGAVALCKSISVDIAASKCDCDPNQENPCASDTDCLNRMLLTECSPNVCAAGARCCNQHFEKRIYPPLTPSRTSERGWGLKILADIKQGDFIIEYVGEVIDESEFQRRMKLKEEMRDENYYFLTLDTHRMIDAGPKGNVARFMNHSCEPNCETQKWTVNGDIRVGLFALRDIKANEELTFNYNLSCAGDVKKTCLCGAPRCGGYIGAKVKPLQEDLPVKKPKGLKKSKRKNRKSIKKDFTISYFKTESTRTSTETDSDENGSDNGNRKLRRRSSVKKSYSRRNEQTKRKYNRKKKPIVTMDLIEKYCKKVPAEKDTIEDDLMIINGTKIPDPSQKKSKTISLINNHLEDENEDMTSLKPAWKHNNLIKDEEIETPVLNGHFEEPPNVKLNGFIQDEESDSSYCQTIIKNEKMNISKRRSSSVHFSDSVTLIIGDMETKVTPLNDSISNGLTNGFHADHALEKELVIILNKNSTNELT